MGQSQDKGNALEKAVKNIEESILRAFPAYNEKTFRVEWKKLIVAGDVTHEIDVWVEIELGSGYSSLVIFECKNRKALDKFVYIIDPPCRGFSASDEDGQALLREMMVIGEDFRDSLGATDVHRNAVRQAVALVKPLSVERQTLHEYLPRLRQDGHVLPL